MRNALHFDRAFDTASILDRLRDAAEDVSTPTKPGTGEVGHDVVLDHYTLNVDLAMALVDFLLTKYVRRLELIACRGPSEALMAVLLATNKVDHLVVTDCNLTTDSFFTLGASLPTTTLQSLTVTNPIYAHDMKSFASGLAGSRLRCLRLPHCRLFGADSVLALAEALRENQELRELDFSGCYLADKHVSTLVQALEEHPTLEVLTLAHNEAHSAGSFLANDNLVELDLSAQRMNPDQSMAGLLESLESSLKENRTLRKLSLARNELKAGDVSKVLEAYLANPCIRELDLSFNALDGACLKSIKCCLSSVDESSEKRLILANNKLSQKSLDDLRSSLPVNVEVIA